MTTIGLDEVKAIWAFSEIASPRSGRYYMSPIAKLMRQKILSGVKLAELDSAHRKRLIRLQEGVRGALNRSYLSRTKEFEQQDWSADRLGRVRTMHYVNADRLVHLKEYVAAVKDPARRRNLDAQDVRRICHADYLDSKPYRSELPIVVGTWGRQPVLVDGYYRSILFLLSARADETIPALVPVTGRQRVAGV